MSTVIDRRKDILLKKRQKLCLAVEGKYTNLKIWVGSTGPGNLGTVGVYTRLDIYKQVSSPISYTHQGVLGYVNDVDKRNIIAIIMSWNWPAPIERLDDLLHLTSKWKERELLQW